jgi:predicted aspartyl protease
VTRYDSENFDPPAPVASVTICNPETGAIVGNVLMLIDTGADATLIPRSVADQLRLVGDTSSQYELAGFDGTHSYAVAVQAELVLLRRTFRGQFLIIDQPFGILGRNVLNSIPLFLDGPRLNWDEK